MAHYNYGPLDQERDEMRLLVIPHDRWDAPLRCSIRVVSLLDQPIYRTLSYVWGNPTPQKDIFLNDHKHSVNPNLFDAIRRLRASNLKDQQLEIWIDAVCVNQESLPERGYSVSLMRKIYSQCTEVIVWMGEIDREDPGFDRLYAFDEDRNQELRDDHDLGCECLEETWASLSDQRPTKLLPEQIKLGVEVLHRLGTARDCNDLQLCRVFADARDITACLSLIQFLDDNAWFSRSWTVQEAILPPTVQLCIGPILFSFDVMINLVVIFGTHLRDGCCTTMAYLHSMQWDTFGRCTEIFSVREIVQAGEPCGNFFAIRALFMGRKASLDVDLIYSVLGLCQSDIAPRYERAVEEVYMEVSKAILQAPKSCDCYGFATFIYAPTKNRYPHLPSWTMDWTSLERRILIDSKWQWLQMQMIPDHPMSLSDGEASGHSFAEHCLILRGHRLDSIVITGDTNISWNPGPVTDRNMQSVHQWRDMVLAHHLPNAVYELPDGYASTGHSWATTWFRSICQSRRLGHTTAVPGLQVLSDEEVDIILTDSQFDPSNIFILQWEPHFLANPSVGEGAQLLARMARPDLYMQTVSAAYLSLHQQKMFLSQHNYMGIGNQEITQGDVLFLSEKCGRPLIMRPVHDSLSRLGRQTYKIISSCYMEGFMKGPNESTGMECEEFWIE